MEGSYIGIMVDDSPGLLAGLLGILKSGNSFVPINPGFPNERIGFIIDDCKIRILLTDKANYEKAQQIAETVSSIAYLLCIDDENDDLTIENIEKRSFLPPGRDKTDLNGFSPTDNDNPVEQTCYVIYTSGSTGRPKGVPITHRNLNPLFSWFRDYFRLGEHTRVLQNLSYTFDFGVFEILTTLLFGGCLFVLNKKTIGDFTIYTHYINKHKINTLHTTPVFFSNIANPGKKMPFVKLLHLGGERLTGKIIQNAATVVPNDCFIYNGYGPTEATINCSILALTAGEGARIEENADVPIGRPSAANEIYILDKYNHAQPIGAAGELCVSGEGLAHGYLNRPELTVEKFTSLPLYPSTSLYRTGDLARWLPDGNIQFLGRIDHQVKVRGFRIELGEIENRLFKSPEVKEAVVTAREHSSGTHYLCAYIVTHTPGPLTVSQLREHLSKELPDYMIPSYFIQLERLPVTPNGKLDRKALPGPEKSTIGTGVEYVAPVTDTEKKLVKIWLELLRIEAIGIMDDFFELGGDSILVNRCIARIREELQVEIPLRKFFERPYIKALSREIERQERQVSSIKPMVREGEIPLSFAQERLWFLQELDAENVAYFVPRVIRMRGELDVELLERTFTEILRRHEILRTLFPTIDGRPVQRIRPAYPFKIPVFDWSRENAEQQGQTISGFLKEEGQRPFDFEKGPLLRVTLLKLKKEEHLLVLTEHHLIHDGWTQGVLLREFIEIFTAYSEGNNHPLPDLPIQYADFAIWQRNYLKGDVLERHLDYWKEKLSGLAPLLDLPSDRPRPTVISGEGAMKAFHLSGPFTLQLKDFSRKNGATLFMTMLALFKTFLYRYTGVGDLCVGTGIANRRYKEMEGMLGMVINTLPLRTQVAGEITFSQCLKRVKETCLEAYQHEDTPFGKIVEMMKPERSLSYTPIFQVLFSFMDTPTENLRLPGLELHLEETHNRSSKFDINVVVVPPGDERGETLVEWEYNTDIFDAPFIDRMIAHYTRLLEEILHTPEKDLSMLPLLSDKEIYRLLYVFNGTTSEYPKDKTIHQLFEEQAKRTGHRIALVGSSYHVGTRFIASDTRTSHLHITYLELNEKSNRLTRLLMEKGVRPGSIVGIMGDRSVEMIIGILGILKAGGVYLPIDADYPEQRKQYMLADSGANVLITAGPIPKSVSVGVHIDSCRDEWPIYRVRESGRDESAIRPYMIDAENLAYIMYTSGSTGQPKGVMVTHRNVVRLVKNTDYAALGEETRILQTGAPVFDATTFEIWGSLLNNGQLVLTDKEVILDAHVLAGALQEYHINTLWLSAPLFNQLMQQNIELFEPLTYLLVGGDVLSPPHINRVKQRFPGLKVINGYGPTENTTFSTTYLIEKAFEQAIPIGSPIANSTAYIVDRHNRVQPIGVWGELVVGGDGVSMGYLNSPELTAKRFDQDFQDYQDDQDEKEKKKRTGKYSFNSTSLPLYPSTSLYRTGDLARWLGDGTIEFKGRMDRQVKIRGFRIELGEIENRLCDHEQVKEAVVIDRQNKGEKYLCAYIVPFSLPAPGAAELRDHLSTGLPGYMIPSFFIPAAQIPLTPNGKIDRKSLPGPAVDDTGTETSGQHIAPRDGVEKKLAQIWEEVLNIEGIGIDDNFFDLGGHSLNAAFLVSKIHNALNVKIPLKELFIKGSIRSLAEYLKEAEEGKCSLIEAAEKKEYYPLSPAQKRLYLLHQMDETSTVYNIPAILEPEGGLDINRLEEVFGKLIQRHESLRTSFHMPGDEPVQKIIEKAAFEIEYYPAAPDPLPLISGFVRPFNLSQAPLLRVGLIKRPCILMVDMHHIITDGTSMGVFVKEFTALYSGAAIPPLTLRYRDYAQWQHQQQESGAVQAQAAYWQDRFREKIPVLELPIDFARPTVPGFEGTRTAFELTAEETRGLKEWAAAEGVTLYTVLLAVFYVFLAKISSAETIVIGTVTAGRRHADLAKIIGMFVNTLALKNHPQNQKTFKEFLKEVNEKTLEALENQDFPFEELVERLPVNRDTGRHPLFDVMFIMQNVDIPEIEIPGLKLKPFPYESTTSKFDLMLQAVEKGEKLLFIFEYRAALFRQDTIDRFKGYFKRSACAVMDCPFVKLSEIEIISEEEKRRILFDFNDTAADYPKDKTIHQLFEEQAERAGDKIAVIGSSHLVGTRFIASGTGTTSITYGELNEKSNRLARLLREKGVKPDTVVGIMVERSLEMIIGIIAVLKAGGAYLPIDPEYPGERIRYMLADSAANVLITAGPMPGGVSVGVHIDSCRDGMPIYRVRETAQDLKHISTDRKQSGRDKSAFRPYMIDAHNLAYIIYTSGTTGKPRGVMIEHRSLVNLCSWHNRNYHVREYDNATQYAGIGFDASVWEIFPYLIKGASLHIIRDAIKLDIEKLDRYYEKNHITISFLPTQMCEQFMALENRSLRKLLTGGDKLRIFKKRDYDLYNNYGPTENTVVNTSYIVKKYDENIPIGKPVANNRIYILDSHNLHIQPVGTAGELCIAGDGLARGYLNNPELTNKSFVGVQGAVFQKSPLVAEGKLYKTGDLARWLPDGNIQFLGRIDHQVKIRGFRIELGEVENQLLKHKKIKEAVVIDREDESKEKYLCAYIAPNGGAPAVAAAELREFLSRTLPAYMIPSFFVPVAQIPLTPNGKIDRNSLPLPAGEIDTGAAYAAARSKEEMLIRDIWQEVLQLDRVGIHDNFFDLGGNSLKVIAVSRKLKQVFNRDIPVVILFRYTRISALAEYLTREQGDEEETPKPRLKERARGKNKQKNLKARRRR